MRWILVDAGPKPGRNGEERLGLTRCRDRRLHRAPHDRAVVVDVLRAGQVERISGNRERVEIRITPFSYRKA
jgi:hypothetical protein